MERRFSFTPFVGVNDLKFGISQETICEILGEPKRSVPYGYPNRDMVLLDYGYLHLVVDKDNKLIFISLMLINSSDDFFIEYSGRSIQVNIDADTLVPIMQELFSDFQKDDNGEGYTSIRYGIGIFCPEDEVEDVVIFSEGHVS